MENTLTKPNRYSDTELSEFKAIILSKMAVAQQEYKDLMATLDAAPATAMITAEPMQPLKTMQRP